MRRGRADHARHGDTEASPRPQAPGAQTSTAAGPSSASYAASGPLDAGGANSSDQDTTSMGFHFNIPSAYFSTTAKQQAHCWVHDGQGMVYKEVSYCPLLHQVADVVLAGVAHTKLLTGEPPKEVFVTLDKELNIVRVEHTGAMVPVEMEEEEGEVMVPELLFRTKDRSAYHYTRPGTNAIQHQQLIGRPETLGYKLCNLLSINFDMDIRDNDGMSCFSQTYVYSGDVTMGPMYMMCQKGDNSTTICCHLDLLLFGLEELGTDDMALMRKRVYDLAAVVGPDCQVELIERDLPEWRAVQVPVTSFPEYCELYLGPKENGMPRVYGRVSDNWEVCISASDSGFQQVSLVNGFSTTGGGTHVDWVVDQVTEHLVEVLGAEGKAAGITPALIKDHLWVFVNGWLAANATFTSQTRDTLITPRNLFGDDIKLPDELLEEVAQSGIIDIILSSARRRGKRQAAKGAGSSRGQHGTGTHAPQLQQDQTAGADVLPRRSSRLAAKAQSAPPAAGDGGPVLAPKAGAGGSLGDLDHKDMTLDAAAAAERSQATGQQDTAGQHPGGSATERAAKCSDNKVTTGASGGASSSKAAAPAPGAPPASPWHGRTRSTSSSKAAAPSEAATAATTAALQGGTGQTPSGCQEATAAACPVAMPEAPAPQQLEGIGGAPVPLPAAAPALAPAAAARRPAAAAAVEEARDWGALPGSVLIRIFCLASSPGSPGLCAAAFMCRSWRSAVEGCRGIHLLYRVGRATADQSLSAWLRRYPRVLDGVTIRGSKGADAKLVLDRLERAAITAVRAKAPLELHTLRVLGPGRRPLYLRMDWTSRMLPRLPRLRTLQVSLDLPGFSFVGTHSELVDLVQEQLEPLQQATQLEDLHLGGLRAVANGVVDNREVNPAVAAMLPANLKRLSWQWYGPDNSETCSLKHLKQLTFLQAMANDRQPTLVPLLAAAAKLPSLRHLHLRLALPTTLAGLSVFTGLSRLTFHDKTHCMAWPGPVAPYTAWGKELGRLPALKWLTVSSGMFQAGQGWLGGLKQLQVLVVDATFDGNSPAWTSSSSSSSSSSGPALPPQLRALGLVLSGASASSTWSLTGLVSKSKCYECEMAAGSNLEVVDKRILQLPGLPAELRALV